MCLQALKGDYDEGTPPELIKQKSEAWFARRKLAKITGSTINKAIGLGTLKDQRSHYDAVIEGKKSSEPTASANIAMEHGTLNELNAVGVLVGKVLPVYMPQGRYYEEGCYAVDNTDHDSFLVVSPDGSCRIGNEPQMAVEIKCPLPGKIFTPDVHYTIPDYYICQILSEMHVLCCQELLYLCWTPQSTTVMRADYDGELWQAIHAEMVSLYDGKGSKPTRPKRKGPNVDRLKQLIKLYKENKVVLLAEFPSTVSSPCHHTPPEEIVNVRGTHGAPEQKDVVTVSSQQQLMKVMQCSIHETQEVLSKTSSCLHEMYNVLRIPAKEVLVTLISDLDRTKQLEQVHAMPIAYGLSGYSLKVESIRKMTKELIEKCNEKGLNVLVVSTDGQFYQMCVRDDKHRPLTVLQVAKDSWDKAKKISKANQVNHLMMMNRSKNTGELVKNEIDLMVETVVSPSGATLFQGPMVVHGWKDTPWPLLYTPPRLEELLKSAQKKKENDNINQEDNSIFDVLPPDAMNEVLVTEDNVDSDFPVASVNQPVSSDDRSNDDSTQYVHIVHEEPDVGNADDDMENEETEANEDTVVQKSDEEILTEIVVQLQKSEAHRKKAKWNMLNRERLKKLLSSDARYVRDTFTKEELGICFSHAQIKEHVPKPKWTEMTKIELVNAVCRIFGNGTQMTATKSPKKLRMIIKDLLCRHFNKECLNAITATHLFLSEDLPAWRDSASFKDGVSIGSDEDTYIWYSQPEYLSTVEKHVLFLLDCHHLFVNARSFVCQHGISGLNVSRDAWIQVAESSTETGVGLSIAMVKDLIDRQSNAIAQIVFGCSVEDELRKTGWTREAEFCSRIRNWYRAEDEPGISAMDRHQARMNMREMLLNAANLASFPPPGSHVAGMPIVMFEGILTNIDRRTQLYALVPGNAYNVRAPNTLDAENLFGEFQELDPKSTGVLLADDIPSALQTASYIMQMRLNPDRSFLMHTSASVYPANPLQECCVYEELEPSTNLQQMESLTKITLRDHVFDLENRRHKQVSKRKRAEVSHVDKPCRGSRPVREYHRVDNSKILPHIRYGLSDI